MIAISFALKTVCSFFDFSTGVWLALLLWPMEMCSHSLGVSVVISYIGGQWEKVSRYMSDQWKKDLLHEWAGEKETHYIGDQGKNDPVRDINYKYFSGSSVSLFNFLITRP